MRILAIETSCDETAVALLEITGPIEKPEVKVLGNNLYSQAKLHEEFGGVYPALAKREHIKNLPILLEKTLSEAALTLSLPRRGLGKEVDFIAVTQGPGLEPALWTGIAFAEELGAKWGKPVIPTNHMKGHIWSVLPGLQEGESLHLPALALLISGGHTELVYIKEFGSYEILGRTKDDAVGEAFDKVARMLGLPYPGGPEISRLAEISRSKGGESPIVFPRPMINSGDLNFSFSGLKTAVLYKLKADQRTDEEYKIEVARSFEDAVTDVLVGKTRQALEAYDIKTLIVAGGVAASARVRKVFEEMIKEFPDTMLLIPEKKLSTDNAIMIGVAAYVETLSHPTSLSHTGTIEAEGNLTFTPPR
jgi:N6-L-threonylcarbamoyladenine synthase